MKRPIKFTFSIALFIGILSGPVLADTLDNTWYQSYNPYSYNHYYPYQYNTYQHNPYLKNQNTYYPYDYQYGLTSYGLTPPTKEERETTLRERLQGLGYSEEQIDILVGQKQEQREQRREMCEAMGLSKQECRQQFGFRRPGMNDSKPHFRRPGMNTQQFGQYLWHN